MVSKHVTNFCKGIIVTLTLNLSLTLQTWHSLHVDKKCSWLGPSGGGSGYIVHVRGGDCFVPIHSSYWGKHFARLSVMPYFFVRLLSANTSFKRLPLDFARWNAYFQKISISPEGAFVLTTQPNVLVIAHCPWNFHDFPTWLDIPWKEYFCQKCWCIILQSMPSPSPRISAPFGPPSPFPQNILCPSLACMDIFWNYTILAVASKPRASPILWMFRFGYHF